jgi:hypothetical protein
MGRWRRLYEEEEMEDVDHSAEYYGRERDEFDENKVSKRTYDGFTEDL